MKKLLIATLASVVATSALAFPVDLVSIKGTFSAPKDNSGWLVNGVDTNQIRWGFAWNQSGYNFDGAQVPLTINNENPFQLGTFTHVNNPIWGGAITGVDLTVDLGFEGFGDTGAASGSFTFEHDETPNTAPVVTGTYCDGRWSWFWGICRGTWRDHIEYIGDVDDEVWILGQAVTSSEFQLGNKIFSLDLVGFEGDLVTFMTAENDNTSIGLLAKLNVRDVEVPEPATFALFGLGLAGLVASRRRQKNLVA